MSRSERDKGQRGEREVGQLLEAHDFELRALAHTGDRLAFGHGLTLHVESKWQERCRWWEWCEQASSEAPTGTLPLLAMRRSWAPWFGVLPLETLLEHLWPPLPKVSPTGIQLPP